MQIYAPKILEALVQLLTKSITENHQGLQNEILSLIGTIADVIEQEFAQYFGSFIPILVSNLTSADS